MVGVRLFTDGVVGHRQAREEARMITVVLD